MRKATWLWRRFLGETFWIVYPNQPKIEFLKYHKKYYPVAEWKEYFKQMKGEKENAKECRSKKRVFAKR